MMQDRVGRENINWGLNTPSKMRGSLTDQMVTCKHGLESKEEEFLKGQEMDSGPM